MTSEPEDLIAQARKFIKQDEKSVARRLLLDAARRKASKIEALELLVNLADNPDERHKYLARLEKARSVNSPEPEETREAETKVRKSNIFQILWRKKNRPLTIMGSVVFTVLPFLWLLYNDVWPELRAIRQMTGEWNVAVASFTDLDTDLRRSDIVLIGSIFTNRFAQQIELLSDDANLVVQVWGPQQVDRSVSGDSSDVRAVSAEKLAADLNADLIIYGTIQQSENGYSLQPEFYIRAENNYEADELIGEHRFGGPIAILSTRDSLPTQLPLNIELARRSEILALVARGLSLYLVHSYDQALELFSQANQDEFWTTAQGRETICLFQGNAAIRAQQYDQARQAYTQAIQIDPQYGRGYVGLGNVTYLLAMESASGFTFAPDQEGLLQAIAYFEQALQAQVQPHSAEIPSRAAFGMGQIYLVQWFSGQETRDLAIEQFSRVLENYAIGENARLQELASETHARLGVIYRQDEQIDLAINELQQALELSTLPARRGLNWATLGSLYDGQSNAVEAQNARRQSIEQYKLAIALPISNELRAFYWMRIGDQYEALKEPEPAIQAYQQACSLLPSEHVDYLTCLNRLNELQP